MRTSGEDGEPFDSGAQTGHASSPQRYFAIITGCVVLLTVFVAVFFLWWLRGVLIPLTFAVFLAFLCEPILRLLVRAPERFGKAVARRACPGRSHPRGSGPGGEALLPPGGEEQPAGPAGGAAPPPPEGDDPEPPPSAVQQWERSCGGQLLHWLQSLWDVIAVLLCFAFLLGFIGGIIFGVVRVCTDFDWKPYADSPKWKQLEDFLRHIGVLDKDKPLDFAAIWSTFKSVLLDAASSVLDFTENVIVTALIFLFCLLAMLPSIHDEGQRSRVQGLVQTYLICKTVASALIAGLVALALAIMQVPLVPFFAVVTFFLNYIPNIGSLIAVLAPAPLVWLKPETTLLRVVLVVLVQFGVHNAAGNIIEPKIMASGLDLHPLTVIVALTFWGSIWDIPGTILSVPISCAFRLWLGELNHPVAQALHAAFTSPLGFAGGRRREADGRPPTPSGQPPAAALAVAAAAPSLGAANGAASAAVTPKTLDSWSSAAAAAVAAVGKVERREAANAIP